MISAKDSNRKRCLLVMSIQMSMRCLTDMHAAIDVVAALIFCRRHNLKRIAG
jgi:hypothetical protein